MKIQRDKNMPLSFTEWVILRFFGWLTGGWVRIPKDGGRFRSKGVNFVPCCWGKSSVIVVKFVIDGAQQEGFLARDESDGNRYVYLASSIPAEKLVAVRLPRPHIDLFFLVPQGTQATWKTEFVEYTTVDKLATDFPAAVLL